MDQSNQSPQPNPPQIDPLIEQVKSNPEQTQVNQGLVHEKVLLPSASLIEELQTAQPASPPLQSIPQNPTQPVLPTTTSEAKPQQTAAIHRSIYPEATMGIGNAATPIAPIQSTPSASTKSVTLTFSEGYSIGRTIFWFQLLAGIVLGVLFSAIFSIFLNHSSLALYAVISLVNLALSLIIVAYIPYKILNEDGMEDPFSLTILGIAVQLVIGVSLFVLVNVVIVRLIINNISAASSQGGIAGIGLIAIIADILSFVAGYYLTRISWGAAFSLFGKIKNRLIIRSVGIAIIAIIFGGFAYHYFTFAKL